MTNLPDEDDVVVIMCMLANQLTFPTPGAVKKPCSDCREMVWVAPSSVKFMEGYPQARILCNECGMLAATKHKMEHPDEEFVADAVPGASKEFTARVRGYLNAENN